MLLVMACTLSLFSQEDISPPDTVVVRADTIVFDTVPRIILTVSPDAIDKKVNYKSEGTKRNDLGTRGFTCPIRRRLLMMIYRSLPTR